MIILNVLLMILKIIGIILASVIGLILFLLLLILFVPFRYRIAGHKLSDIYAEARVSWLLHIFSFKIIYTGEGSPSTKLRIFGIPVYDSTKPKKERNSKSKSNNGEEQNAEDKSEASNRSEAKDRSTTEISEGIQTDKAGENGLKETKAIEDNDKQTLFLDDKDSDQYSSEDSKESSFETWRKKVIAKCKAIGKKIKQIVMAPIHLVQKMIKQYKLVAEFLQNETNQEGLKLTWNSIKKLLKHMGPRRVKGQVSYGTGDPSTTGYILAVLGALYGKFGKGITIQPDFVESCFSGEIKIWGRIYTIVIVLLVIKLWYNKSFKQLKENFNIFKNDIKQPISV